MHGETVHEITFVQRKASNALWRIVIVLSALALLGVGSVVGGGPAVHAEGGEELAITEFPGIADQGTDLMLGQETDPTTVAANLWGTDDWQLAYDFPDTSTQGFLISSNQGVSSITIQVSDQTMNRINNEQTKYSGIHEVETQIANAIKTQHTWCGDDDTIMGPIVPQLKAGNHQRFTIPCRPLQSNESLVSGDGPDKDAANKSMVSEANKGCGGKEAHHPTGYSGNYYWNDAKDQFHVLGVYVCSTH